MHFLNKIQHANLALTKKLIGIWQKSAVNIIFSILPIIIHKFLFKLKWYIKNYYEKEYWPIFLNQTFRELWCNCAEIAAIHAIHIQQSTYLPIYYLSLICGVWDRKKNTPPLLDTRQQHMYCNSPNTAVK